MLLCQVRSVFPQVRMQLCLVRSLFPQVRMKLPPVRMKFPQVRMKLPPVRTTFPQVSVLLCQVRAKFPQVMTIFDPDKMLDLQAMPKIGQPIAKTIATTTKIKRMSDRRAEYRHDFSNKSLASLKQSCRQQTFNMNFKDKDFVAIGATSVSQLSDSQVNQCLIYR